MMISIARLSRKPLSSKCHRFMSLNLARTGESLDLNMKGGEDAKPRLSGPTGNNAFSSNPESAYLLASEYRSAHEIQLKGEDCESFLPLVDFQDTPFSSAIKRVFTKEGYTSPTHIQAQSWPIGIAKRDLISIARTGSGKTCAFLLPALHNLSRQREGTENSNKDVRQKRVGYKKGPVQPSMLVLAPTRELAVQIHEEAMKFSGATGLRTMVAHGGGAQIRNKQIYQLQRLRPQIMVCTPGRCNDFIEEGLIDLSQCGHVVLDEADRMLDMGFQPQIESIIESTPDDRQTSLFSATWPREVRGLAADYLTNPVQLRVGNGKLAANKNITQSIQIVEERAKFDTLLELLKELDPEGMQGRRRDKLPKMIIFRARKSSCDHLVDMLRDFGVRSDSIHGDKSQSARNNILNKFRIGRTNVLVATDVASRGIDIRDIEAVINYDVPDQAEDYVHRIGRTGRGEAGGRSFTFVTPAEMSAKTSFSKGICDILGQSDQEVPRELQELADLSQQSYSRRGRSRGRDGRDSHRGHSSSRSFGRQGGRGSSSFGSSSRRNEFSRDDARRDENRYHSDGKKGGYSKFSRGRSVPSRDRYGGQSRYDGGGGRQRSSDDYYFDY